MSTESTVDPLITFDAHAKAHAYEVSSTTKTALMTLFSTVATLVHAGCRTVGTLVVGMVAVLPGYESTLHTVCRYVIGHQYMIMRLVHSDSIADVARLVEKQATASRTSATEVLEPISARVHAVYVEEMRAFVKDIHPSVVDSPDASVHS